MSNLDALFAKLLSEVPAKGKRAKANGGGKPPPKPPAVEGSETRDARLLRLASPRWRDEALVMIVSRGLCSCGASYEYPHQNLFIRRWHPQYGLHFEALKSRPRYTSLPFQLEIDEHPLASCPRCFTQAEADALQRQMFLPLTCEV